LGVKGLAVALIRNGRVVYLHSFGIRNAKGDPLTADTVMYAASLTKATFVLEAAGEGAILAGQAEPHCECSMAVSGDGMA
jgi:CubicO group peptidase (beta-lactamase class C family)